MENLKESYCQNEQISGPIKQVCIVSLDKNVSTQICSFWLKFCFQFSKNLTFPNKLQRVLESKKILT